MANKLLNFRCPDELLAAIDELGRSRYPANNDNGCDRSKTLLDLLQAGLIALTDGTVVLPDSKTSKTDSKTDCKIDSKTDELENDVYGKTESKTIDKTEVEVIVETRLTEMMNVLQEQLREIDARLGKLKTR